jgi:hypothetical protein
VGIPTIKNINMAVVLTNTYETKLDEKKRMTLRGSKYKYFLVKVYNNGSFLIEPQVLVPPEYISKRTLKMVDKSIENLKKGKTSKKINFKKYL